MKDQVLGYSRNILFQSELFEVIQCFWKKGVESDPHTHGDSQCYTLIKSGVFENRTNTYLKSELTIHEPGQSLTVPAGSQHVMTCLSETGETIHVYTPKLSEEKKPAQFRTASVAEMKNNLDVSLSGEGVNWDSLVRCLEKIRGASVSTDSKYFMNQLFSGVLPEMVLAAEYIAKTRTTLATHEASPVLSAIEMEVVKNLGQLIGWRDGEVEGVSVPGGSAANFMALHCARQRSFPDYKQKGLAGLPTMRVFVSKEAHYSFQKACVAMGFGSDALVAVDTDGSGRMCVQDLKRRVQNALEKNEVPLLVAATAGTTVLGVFDPIDSLADFCQENKIWLHVDGAWGGPALFSSQLRPLMKGIEKADSMTFDAHKLFGASLTCSYFLTNDSKILLQANDVSGADYLFHDGNEIIDRGRLSWQCGRAADSLSFWSIWKRNGTQQLGTFVDRLVQVRNQALPFIRQQPRLQLIAEPGYLNICVQVLPPSEKSETEFKNWSRKTRDVLKMTNQSFVNYSTKADGTTFLRMILAHPEMDSDVVQTILNQALAVQ